MDSLMEKMLAVVPHERQINWQKLEFTAFLHFGMNTFTGREWGDGSEDPAIFHPTELDTDQWCKTMADSGIRACIITAKHHDGFCLWPSAHTEHSVKNSPCKRDIVGDVAASCKKYGLKFGVYLSPWDRHDATYGFGTSYNDYFCNQLTELLSNYGEVYTVWFDGACGEGSNGKKQVYDWERYYALIRQLQPNAVISVCGPDVRWCGNEAGSCRSSEWSVVPAYLADNEKIHEASQQEDNEEFRERKPSSADDLGSRELLQKSDQLIWYPAEVNTSIRPGWFYHPEEDAKVRSLDTLTHIYLNSVGGNSVFLLNLPPDKRGLFSDADCVRLREIGQFIQRFSTTIPATITASATAEGFSAASMEVLDESYWKAPEGTESCEIVLTLSHDEPVSYITLMEQIRESQRVEAFTVSYREDGVWKTAYTGTTVGYKRICPLQTPIISREWKISILESRNCPTLKFVGLHR